MSLFRLYERVRNYWQTEIVEPEILRKIEAGYDPDMQMTAGQVFAVASAIAACRPKPNVLIFGCGNDSPLWHDINDDGFTLFLENDAKWLERTKERFPQLKIEKVSYEGRTVADSLPIDEKALAEFAVPERILRKSWDVILVDSPMGHQLDGAPAGQAGTKPVHILGVQGSGASHSGFCGRL
jgi:hypothetical protein